MSIRKIPTKPAAPSSFQDPAASLINYDDLVGIPVPDETKSSLRNITTPTAIWDAEVVFVDELNRTRPDLQNKLFPIIHERRVQGVELEKLRYRWAAMNPATNGEHDEQELYLGTEPLDPALADRFGFLIEVPDWSDLSEAERTDVLLDQFRAPHEFPMQIPALVEESTAIFRELCARPPIQLCGYFVALESQLRAAGTRFSSRRMTTLFRTSLGIQASRIALSIASDETGFPLSEADLSSVILEAVASRPVGAQKAAIALVLYLALRSSSRIAATAAETLASQLSRVLRPFTTTHNVYGKELQSCRQAALVCSGLKDTARDKYARNLLNAFLPDGYAEITPQELHAEFITLWERFGVPIADPKNRL
jgi:hypothetical protein